MLGYPKIKVLHGGYDAWAAAGLPTTTDVPSPVKASFSIVPEAGDILIDAKTMLAARRQARHRAARRPRRRRVDRRKLLALRQGFLPAQGPHPRRGLARMVPHDEADRGRPALQVARTKSWRNAPPSASRQNTPVYLYCFKGARASNTFLALKNAGVKDVRMYFGSWNEWSRDPSLPIDEGLPTAARSTGKAA